MKSSAPKKSAARQRLLETARRLFNAEGFRAVGIDRIIAESDVAKTTLYKHFPSKDDLIVAVLQEYDEDVVEIFRQAIEQSVMKGGTRIEGLFRGLKRWFESPEFRGCVFINASIELADAQHPASRFAAQHKHELDQLIHQIVSLDHNSKIADAVAPAISLLVEGAIVTALLYGETKPADVAKKAALNLIRSKESGC